MTWKPPDDTHDLIELMDEIDNNLPLCNNSAFQMTEYCHIDDLLQPIRTGKLVVISRLMFRRLRDELKRAKGEKLDTSRHSGDT